MISQEIQDKFFKENWIAITDAISHIQKWTSEKNFQSAENWIKELKNFLWDSEEVQNLEKNLFEIKNSQKWDDNTNKAILNWKEISEWNSNKEVSDEEKSEKIMAALSYASYLVIIPLLLKRDSKLCQHHGKQWLVLVIIFFLFNIVWSLIWFIWWIVAIAQIAIAIYWWMKAYKWEMWTAPIIWDAAKKIKL